MATPDCEFVNSRLVPSIKTPVEVASRVAVKKQPQHEDGGGNDKSDNSDNKSHSSDMVVGHDVESIGIKEQQEDELSWLGLPPTRADKAEVDENEDLIDFGC